MKQHPHSPVFSDTPTYYQPRSWSDEQWRTDVLSAVDWLGHTFKVGERVMYCIGAGRGQMMALGTVQQIRAKPGKHWDLETRRYVEEGVFDVEVQVLTEKTSGHWGNKERSKPAWVNPMNITAITEAGKIKNN